MVSIYDVLLNTSRVPYLVKEKEVEYAKIMSTSAPEFVDQFFRDVFHMDMLPEEHLFILALASDNSILGVFEISRGTVNKSIVSPRELLQRLLLIGAVGFILCHNHPSQNVQPSQDDISVTGRIKSAAELLDIKLLDHVIIGNGFYSFAEQNLI